MLSQPPGLPAIDTIDTHRLSLTPLTEQDAASMAGVLAGEELYHFIRGEPPTVEDLHSRYRRWASRRSDDGSQEWLNWVVRRRPSLEAVGTVQATVVPAKELAEVAWIVGLEWQGRGYASEAVSALVDWLECRGVRRVIAHVHPEHAASNAVARRAGLIPTAVVHDGEVLWERLADMGRRVSTDA